MSPTGNHSKCLWIFSSSVNPLRSLPFQIWTSPEEGAVESGPESPFEVCHDLPPASCSRRCCQYPLYENALVCAAGAVPAVLSARAGLYGLRVVRETGPNAFQSLLCPPGGLYSTVYATAPQCPPCRNSSSSHPTALVHWPTPLIPGVWFSEESTGRRWLIFTHCLSHIPPILYRLTGASFPLFFLPSFGPKQMLLQSISCTLAPWGSLPTPWQAQAGLILT